MSYPLAGESATSCNRTRGIRLFDGTNRQENHNRREIEDNEPSGMGTEMSQKRTHSQTTIQIPLSNAFLEPVRTRVGH